MKKLITIIALLLASFVGYSQKTTIKLQIKNANLEEVSRVMVQQLTSSPYPDSVANPLYTGLQDLVNKPRIVNPETAPQMFERVWGVFVRNVYKNYKKEQSIKAVPEPNININ
jgi:hypothetical protein